MSILVKFSKNVDFGQIFEKFRFFRKSRIISFFSPISENFDFWSEYTKNFDLSKISNFIDFGHIFKNFDFGENFRKIFEFFESFRKISIRVKNFE